MSRLLLEGGTLLGLAERGDIRPATDLYAENGTIAAVGSDARGRAAQPGDPVERFDARGKWVLPGFVQAHLHLCQTLLRNGPEDLELLPWLAFHVWPGEAAHDRDTLSVSARLGLSECLASGVTAVLDMGTVRHSDSLFRAAARAGIRYTGGNVLMDDPTTAPEDLRAPAEEALGETERLVAAWHGRERGRLQVAVSPRFAVSCTDGLLRAAARLAEAKGLTVHTHASENAAECDLVRERTGLENIAYLDSVGLLSPGSCIAHGVHTGEAQWRLLAERGASVAHCPTSNLRLGSGVCPVVPMRRAGVRVALGSDAAACNDRLDPFGEMRWAALLPRMRRPPDSLPAFEALRMATWEGARALRLPGLEGLEPGGRADFVILDPEAGWALPETWGEEPYAAIVFSMGRENVAATIVDGIVRYRASDSSVGGLKPAAREVREAAKTLRSRMGAREGAARA
jgi:cytosine/adenosine deaminase-related metal-dependent hydrolase